MTDHDPSGNHTQMDDAALARLAARLDRPVVLVGMMGVGKSTVGRRLAGLLNLDFSDADDEIEHAAQMSISEMFEQYGEGYFRDGERRVILRLMESGPCVLATGGGAFVQEETRSAILDNGIAVWLDADTDTLVERVTRRDTRPLLRDGDPAEIVARLKAERESAYAHAPIRVTSSKGPHGEAAMRIAKAIEEWL